MSPVLQLLRNNLPQEALVLMIHPLRLQLFALITCRLCLLHFEPTKEQSLTIATFGSTSGSAKVCPDVYINYYTFS